MEIFEPIASFGGVFYWLNFTLSNTVKLVTSLDTACGLFNQWISFGYLTVDIIRKLHSLILHYISVTVSSSCYSQALLAFKADRENDLSAALITNDILFSEQTESLLLHDRPHGT